LNCRRDFLTDLKDWRGQIGSQLISYLKVPKSGR